MPIRPIDLQVMIPKVNEVARMQADERQNSIAISQNKAQNTEKQSEANLKQVNSREETQELFIHEKHEKKDKGSKKRDKEKQSEEKKEKRKSKMYNGGTSGRTIDIRL